MGNSYEEYLKTLGTKYNISESRWSGASKQSEQSSASGFPSGGDQSSYESYIAGIWKKYNIDSGSERKPLRSVYIPTNEEREVSRFFSDYNRLVEDYGNRLDSIGWSDGIGANTELKTSIDGFTERDQNIRKYLEENRSSLNPNYYNEVISGLDSAAEAMRMLQDTYDRNAMFFSQWSSEEDYQKWLDYSTPENRQARYAENQARLEELYRQRDAERARSSQYSPGQNPYTSWNAAASGSVPYGAARQAPEPESDLDREIAAIEAEMRMYERGGTDENGFYYGSKVIDDYGKLRDNADFGAVSGIRTYHNAGKDELDAYDASQSEGSLALNNGGYYDEQGNIRNAKGNIVQYANAPAVEDKLGMFLAASDEDIADAYNLLSVSGGNYETTWADIMQEGETQRWKYLTDGEIDIYYYLLGSQGQEAAYKYLDDMEVELGRRENEETYAAIEGANGWEKAGLSALSVFMNMAGGIASTVDNASRLIRGNELNPYSRAQSLTNASGYIRSATARDIIEATGGVEIPGLGFSAGDAYQAGMSMIDSLVGARLGGTVYQAIMSMGAASSEANRLYDQGASTDQIVLGSAAAGAAEWFFEKYSIENLISMKSPEAIGQFIKNAFIQGGIEFSEEAATEIANIISNGLIMQSRSDWEKLLEENGGDYGAAIKEMAIQVTNAGLGGFISGFGSGLGQQGIAYVAQRSQNRKIGQYISGGDGTDALMALALDMASGSDGKSQRWLRSQVDALLGDKYLTKGSRNQAIGRLYNSVSSVMTEQNIGEISAALQEQGFSKKDASKIAGALAMNYNGIELTAQQEKLVQKYGNDQKVLDAISKVIENGESGIRQRANSMARFEFGTMLGNVASRMNQEAPGQEKSAAEGNLSGENSAVQTDSYEVSDDGQTRLISDPGKVVSVDGIASLENGKVMLQLKDGSTVDAEDVSFGDSGDALIYATAAGLGLSVDTANTIIGAFDSGNGVSAQMYAMGLQEAYRNGKYNYAFQTAENDPYSDAMKLAWNEGRMSALSESGTRQAEMDAKYSESKKSGKEKNGEYKAVLDDGITEESMTESQKASYHLADSIAQAVKVDIIVYAGKTGELGFYDPNTDTIHLNVNGMNKSGKSMMAFTLGHELVHRAKKGSPAKYQAFADFLVENYGKRGADLEAMIAEQLTAANEHGIKMSRDDAFEEVVCDACQRMLLDTDAGKKLAQFGAESRQNKSILSEIKRWIEEFMEKLREIFKGVEPDSLAAQEFAKFDDGVKQILADMYVDMTVDAGEKLGAKDKKLDAEDKARLKQLREQGVSFALPKTGNTSYQEPAYHEWDVQAALYDAMDHADSGYDNMICVGEMPRYITEMIGIEGNFYIYRNHAYENMVSREQAIKDGRPVTRKGEEIHFHDLGVDTMTEAIMSLENPTMTIAAKTAEGNPAVIMILPVHGKNKAPLYAVLSFYSNRHVNGDMSRRPHVVLTIAERDFFGSNGRSGYAEIIGNAVKDGRVIDFNKKMRDDLSVIANPAGVGNITDSSLSNNLSRFRKEIKAFREKNHINYKLPVGDDTSPRALLANAYEELAKTDAEKESIRKYQERVVQFQELETKLKDLRAQIRELYTADGKLDTKKIRELQFEANATANRIETLDRMLLRTESTQQFQNVLKREQDKARAREIKKAKDAVIAFRHDASAEIRETMRDYEAARSALVGRDSDMDIIEREFLRVVKEYEKEKRSAEKTAESLRRSLEKEAQKHQKDNDLWEREFNRMLRQYEKSRDYIGVLERRVDKAKQVRDNAAKRDAVGKLQKLVLDTTNWITYPGKNDVKCPDLLKKPYADFLNGIDLSSKRLASGGDPTKNDLKLANAMGSLATALESITMAQDPSQDAGTHLDSGYLDLPAGFVQTLREMTEKIKDMIPEGQFVVSTMTADDVKQLSKMIRTLNHAIREMSTLYANSRFASVAELSGESMRFMDSLGEMEKTSGAADFVKWDNVLPYYAFKRFGTGGESVFEGLMDAQDKLAFLAQKIFDFQENTWTGKEAKAWGEDSHTIDLPSGGKLTLTTADAMSIYCLSRRQHGLQHLLGGGVRVIGIQKGSTKAKDSRSTLSIQDIDAITSSLTEKQKTVAEAIQGFMSKECSQWGNEISMKRFLTREFNEQFYFPIESNDENLATKDPSAQQSDLFRLLNISATKPLTKNANNEVIIRNIFDVFTGHASDMARLNAFGMPLLDYMKWLNYREKTTNEDGQVTVRGVRKSMETAFGSAAKSYVLNLIKDVNGRASDGGDPSFLMKMMRNAKTAAVGNSLRVATLQMTSYPRAALVLSSKSLALGLTRKPNINRAMKYCGIALWKSFGFYDTNISRSIEDQMKGVVSVKQKMIELSLKGAELGDALTWGVLWNACEYEVAKTTRNKVGSEEFYQEVGKKLREVVYATQVVDSTLTRSQIMRSKRGMAQEAAAFMSEPTLSANILMDAGFQFSMEKRRTGSAKEAWKTTGKYVGRAIAVYSIGQITAAIVEALWDAWRDDDDDEYIEKYWKALKQNLVLDILPFNKIPVISDVVEMVLATAGVGFFSSEKLSTTWLSQAKSAVDAWSDVLNSEGSVTAYGALYKTMRAVSSAYGVSFSGVMREGVALWNNTAGAYDSTLKIRTYELSKSTLAGELLDALVKGDDRRAESLREEFNDADDAKSNLRTAIKNRFASGEIDKSTAMKYLVLYGEMDAGDAYWKVDAWSFDNLIGDGEEYSKYGGFYDAVETGENLSEVIRSYTDNGVDMETLRREITEHFQPVYSEMTAAERAGIREYLINAYEQCGSSREDAEGKLQYWDFLAENPGSNLSIFQVADYYEYAKPAGISAEVYSDYCERVKGITGEGKKARRMAVIDALPITNAQKDALYFAEGWAESKIHEAPWH